RGRNAAAPRAAAAADGEPPPRTDAIRGRRLAHHQPFTNESSGGEPRGAGRRRREPRAPRWRPHRDGRGRVRVPGALRVGARRAPAMAQYTDRGRRPSNQDAVVARHWPDGRAVLAVADGLGGHSAGEVASNRALEVLVAALDSGVSLREAV